MAKRKHSEASPKKKQEQAAAPKNDQSSPSFQNLNGEKREPSKDGWSKSKKKRMRLLKAKETMGTSTEKGSASKTETSKRKQRLEKNKKKRDNQEGKVGDEESSAVHESVSSELQVTGQQSALQKSFLARLSGSRFRELNEDLYTTTSNEAYKRFSSKPELYNQYHEGFRTQVEQWPINPVNLIVKWLSSNFQKHDECFVADFGCGDAELAKKLLAVSHKGKCPFQVNSFDLVASCDLVTACDMSNVPLKDKSVDVAVFCLSLMGTNLADFIREAHRVLKDKGTLKIAEVRSRFESSSKAKKGDELNDFIEILDKLGFTSNKIDKKNTMFVMIECKKNAKKPDTKLEWSAKPCIYKRR